jgi:transcriptional regulator with XRE-family HTH domain
MPRRRYLDGDALRRKRLEAGLEQPELAAMVGASQSQISNWELRYGCRLGMLYKLADALDGALRARGRDGCAAADLALPGALGGKPGTGAEPREPDGAAA